ncbi:mitochondrial proton/calcium exchanger protein [Chrysoperla carnea]|uniref:mitochondrial proton/calcium exchanger protein n=1 Tax=Chrysoperla carnea TaxID=189513 RepID=UPI001D079E2E|nr:mitochondrial proton/calcium exchanger protein [Chrysoperla carnea]
MHSLFGNSKSSNFIKLSANLRAIKYEKNHVLRNQFNLNLEKYYSNGYAFAYIASGSCDQKQRWNNVTNKGIKNVSNYAKPYSQSHCGVPLLANPFLNSSLTTRNFSLTAIVLDKDPLKPSSKVEETVKAIKEQAKEISDKTPSTQVKKKWRTIVWEEVVHYYNGFRLLFIDVRLSTALCIRLLRGKPLTRREHRMLVRTVGDIFRLVPFSVFIIVPFLEFTLPIFLKFFPGMLPSTFQTAKDIDTKMRSSLKVKLEMAKFLQETLDCMAVQNKDRMSQSAKEFTEWFHKVRTTGAVVSNEEILKYLKVFEDEITLDTLDRSQLIALCRVVEVQTLGPSSFLRYQLRMKLRNLAADDKIIQREGIESLSLSEIQQACKARGMRAYGMSEEALRKQLRQWIDLSLNHKVPPSLLLLTRALMLPETVPPGDQLKTTICTLPENIITQTKAAIGEKEGKIDNKVKLELIKEEERKMKEERKEILEIEKRKAQEAQEILKDPAPILSTKADELTDNAPNISCTNKDFEVLEDALDQIGKEKKKLIIEKEEIEDLKEEMADYKEDVKELKEVTMATSTSPKSDIKESKGAKRLYNKVNNMINKLDKVLNQLEKKESQIKEDLKQPQAIAAVEEPVISDQLVQIDELMAAIRKITNDPDNARLDLIERVLGKIDDDRDGSIKVEDVLKVIEAIGKEDVQLSPKQIDELIELIDKEELLEVEDKIEKALHKDKELKLSQSTQNQVSDKTTKTDSVLQSNITPPITLDPKQSSKDSPTKSI